MQHVKPLLIWIASQKSFIVDAAVGEPHQAHLRGAKREESFSLMQQQALLFLSLPRVTVCIGNAYTPIIDLRLRWL
jgi:hypothetical protein